LCGEGGDVDKNDPKLLSKLELQNDIIDAYETEHAYNLNETGLFYRMLPECTVLMSNEDINTVRGKKKARDSPRGLLECHWYIQSSFVCYWEIENTLLH
jgi:hypothetical protein